MLYDMDVNAWCIWPHQIFQDAHKLPGEIYTCLPVHEAPTRSYISHAICQSAVGCLERISQ